MTSEEVKQLTQEVAKAPGWKEFRDAQINWRFGKTKHKDTRGFVYKGKTVGGAIKGNSYFMYKGIPFRIDSRTDNRKLKSGAFAYPEYTDHQGKKTRMRFNPKNVDRKRGEGDFRRASETDQAISRQDYIDYAEANGLSTKRANELFEINEKKLAALRKKKNFKLPDGTLLHYEHTIPTTSQAFGGVEHWRNLTLMDQPSNQWKSDKMITPETATRAGVPLSKAEAIEMDFKGTKSLPPKQIRKLVMDDLKSGRKLQTARELNAQAVYNRSAGRGFHLSGIAKASTGLSRAESVVRIAGGDVVGGTVGLAMTTPTFQKQIGKLLVKQGIKMIPGVSFGSGALQAAGYMMGGQWTKAGLSALGGVIGEFGPAGDAVQAAIDVGLTGHDQFGVKKPKVKGVKTPEPDLVRATKMLKNL